MNIDQSKNKNTDKNVYLINPIWAGLFFVIGGATVVMLGLLVRVTTGLSAASDQVFALEALASGLIAELVFRYRIKKNLLLAPGVEVPFYYFWPWLCLYVFLFSPFE